MRTAMRILVSNDDGVGSDGLHHLVEALLPLGHVTVVAPDRERSAVGHSLTFFHPLRVHRLRESEGCVVYSTDGTPSDCVLLGLYELMPHPPDLVVSGINRGANLGDDITYSGTVSAAMEGLIHGVPSFAVSLAAFEAPFHWETAGVAAARVARSLLEHGLPPRTLLNVNVPNVPTESLKGYVATVQGSSIYSQSVVKRADPRGRLYYWVTGEFPRGEPVEGSDFEAVMSRHVSITPIQLDLTNREFVSRLQDWDLMRNGHDRA